MQLICCLTEVQLWNNRNEFMDTVWKVLLINILNINTIIIKSQLQEGSWPLTSDDYSSHSACVCWVFRPDWFRSGCVPQSPSPDLQRPQSSSLCSNLKVKFKVHRLPEKWIINILQFETSLPNEKNIFFILQVFVCQEPFVFFRRQCFIAFNNPSSPLFVCDVNLETIYVL